MAMNTIMRARAKDFSANSVYISRFLFLNLRQKQKIACMHLVRWRFLYLIYFFQSLLDAKLYQVFIGGKIRTGSYIGIDLAFLGIKGKNR